MSNDSFKAFLRRLTDRVKGRRYRDVTLIHCPPSTMAIPPVGLGWLAEHLRSQGLEAPLVDLNIRMQHAAGPREQRAWGLDQKNIWLDRATLSGLLGHFQGEIDSFLQRVLARDDHVLAFSMIHSREVITEILVERIRQEDPTRLILLGGPLMSSPSMARIWSQRCDYDWAVLGEGELALSGIMTILRQGGQLRSGMVPGLYSRGEIMDAKRAKAPHPPILPLDQLPYPRYDGLDPKDYGLQDPFPMVWGRGCPGRCAFCETHRIWGPFRSRGAHHIRSEMEHIITRFNRTHFTVFDAVINGDVEGLRGLARLLNERGPRVTWEGNFVSSPRMTSDIYGELQSSGCRRIYFGLESGSPRVLDLMRKPFTLAEAIRNIRLAHEAGIDTYVNIITGFPGEGEEELQETLAFLEGNRDIITGVEFITECQIPEGTDLLLSPERYGIVIPRNFQGYRWFTRDGSNTYLERQERSRRVYELCVRLGLRAMPSTTLTDGRAPSLQGP